LPLLDIDILVPTSEGREGQGEWGQGRLRGGTGGRRNRGGERDGERCSGGGWGWSVSMTVRVVLVSEIERE
jgi:hypothetical protein